MRSGAIVVLSPSFEDFQRVGEAQEQVAVEALIRQLVD
jgi:hypothetical protein